MHPLLFQMGVPWNSIISIAACESLKGDHKVTLILFSHLFQDDKRMKFWQGHPDKTTLWPPSNSGTLFFPKKSLVSYYIYCTCNTTSELWWPQASHLVYWIPSPFIDYIDTLCVAPEGMVFQYFWWLKKGIPVDFDHFDLKTWLGIGH